MNVLRLSWLSRKKHGSKTNVWCDESRKKHGSKTNVWCDASRKTHGNKTNVWCAVAATCPTQETKKAATEMHSEGAGGR
jgi:hypothetical protein